MSLICWTFRFRMHVGKMRKSPHSWFNYTFYVTFGKWSMIRKKIIQVRFRLFPFVQSSMLTRRSDVKLEVEHGLNSQTPAGSNSLLKMTGAAIVFFRSLIKRCFVFNNWGPCDPFIPISSHATSCHYFRLYGNTNVSQEKLTGWVCYLDMIDTRKTCLVKLSLAEWKSEIENGKSEFFIGFKWLVTCIFNVLNLKPTNIGLNSSHEENKFKPCLTKQL